MLKQSKSMVLDLTKLKILILKSEKQVNLRLVSKYGPPSFESPFKKNIIYYTSQNTVYKNLSAPQVEKNDFVPSIS